MNFYERHILPPVINLAMQAKPVRYQRRKVVPQASGRVLEVGIGSGLNLPFYDASKVERVIGLDPSAELRRYAEKRAAMAPFPVEFIGLEAERIPLDDKSVDTIVVTFTLCSIPDVPKALDGMRRVLKPGGRLLFAEHGRAPHANVQRWQDRLTPTWRRVFGGCHLNRAVPRLVEEAGFRIDALDTMYLPGTPRFVGFNYWGIAAPR